MAGDEVLKVAHTIASCCDRSTDRRRVSAARSSPWCCPARRWRGARMVAEKIRRSIERPAHPHRDAATSEWLTVSIGVATLVPDRPDRYTQIIDAADRGLAHNAKRRGAIA